MAEITRSEGEWREQLTPEQYKILREAGTEPPFSGRYVFAKDDGVYRCAACGAELFSSDTKFESGTGWPSFTEPVVAASVDGPAVLHQLTRSRSGRGCCRFVERAGSAHAHNLVRPTGIGSPGLVGAVQRRPRGGGWMQADCTFCQIVSGELPADYVDEDEHTVAFMDINPATPGHLLVVSRTHVPDLMSASEEDWLAVAATARRMARLATGAFKAGGVDLVQANSDGMAGAQTIFHLHVHVVPRHHHHDRERERPPAWA